MGASFLKGTSFGGFKGTRGKLPTWVRVKMAGGERQMVFLLISLQTNLETSTLKTSTRKTGSGRGQMGNPNHKASPQNSALIAFDLSESSFGDPPKKKKKDFLLVSL